MEDINDYEVYDIPEDRGIYIVGCGKIQDSARLALIGVPGAICVEDMLQMADAMDCYAHRLDNTYKIEIDEDYWKGKEEYFLMEDVLKPNKPFYRHIEYKRKKGGKQRF